MAVVRISDLSAAPVALTGAEPVEIEQGGVSYKTTTQAIADLAPAGFTNPMTTAGDLIRGGTGGAAERLGVGSAGQVLTVVSGTPAWAAAPSGGAVPVQEEGSTVVAAPTAINFVGTAVTVTDVSGVATVTVTSGGGLTQFTEARSTAAPNSTVPVHSLTASGAETSIDAVIAPKAAGAFALEVSDNTTAGGNKRGANAVDLQMVRSQPAQVASGAESFIGAGRNNRATASNSAAIAGQTNTASGQSAATLGGESCTASGQRAVCLGGNSGVASGNDSASIVGGNANAVSAVAIGIGASANAVIGAFSESTGVGPPRSRYTLSGSTTTATPLVLTTNQGAAAATNQVYFGNLNNRSGIYRGLVVARQTGNGGSKKSWEFIAHLDRDNGTLSLVGAVTPTVVADSGVGWSVAVTANDTLKTLAVTVTGAASTTIRWACYVDGQEVDGT